MFPKRWLNQNTERLNFNDRVLNKANEEHLNKTALKTFQGRVKRYVNRQLLLFRINLEERRNKIRILYEKEEKNIEEEWFKRLIPIGVRREKLKQSAQIIRLQKEVERRAIATEKIFERERLANGDIRIAQGNMEMKEIIKDWKNIKEIDETIKREKYCEKQFWALKLKEENNKMLQRELFENDKRKIISTDVLNQIKENEKRKENELKTEMEKRSINHKQVIELEKEIKEEKLNEYLNENKKKKEFKETLDRHIKLKNLIKMKEKENLESYDKIMKDYNCQKIKETKYDLEKKKNETYKHLNDYLSHTKSINELKKLENKKYEEILMRKQFEQDKKNKYYEDLKQSKYNELIKDIKLAQKNQLLESEKKKSSLLLIRQSEKEAMKLILENEELKEKELKEKQRIKIQTHNDYLIEQIKFNERLNCLKFEEKKREEKSMKDAEENYQRINKEIQDKEQLLFRHPWRVKTT